MRTVEFYSGIGGWSSALKLLNVDHTLVAAFDINNVSNDAFEHNYRKRPSSKTLETVTSKLLDSFDADMWLMSPPCQPYTRNNETDIRDDNDPRSKSFVHLVNLLPQLSTLPRFIALENVIGFEESNCCKHFLHTLHELQYSVLQFHLTPTQFGMPNERPRYYCIARLKQPFPNNNSTEILTQIPGVVSVPQIQLEQFLSHDLFEEETQRLLVPKQTIDRSAGWCFDLVTAESTTTACFTKSYTRYIKGTGSVLLVVHDRIQRSECVSSENDGIAFGEDNSGDAKSSLTASNVGPDNAVNSNSNSSNNLVLNNKYNNDPSQRVYQSDWWSELLSKHSVNGNSDDKGGTTTSSSSSSKLIYLRFFSPEELLRLFGFPRDFVFPPHISNKKRYELIGNSVNVVVVSKVVEYMLSEGTVCSS